MCCVKGKVKNLAWKRTKGFARGGGVKGQQLEAAGSDMVTTVNCHRYAKQSSAELIAEGAIS